MISVVRGTPRADNARPISWRDNPRSGHRNVGEIIDGNWLPPHCSKGGGTP